MMYGRRSMMVRTTRRHCYASRPPIHAPPSATTGDRTLFDVASPRVPKSCEAGRLKVPVVLCQPGKLLGCALVTTSSDGSAYGASSTPPQRHRKLQRAVEAVSTLVISKDSGFIE